METTETKQSKVISIFEAAELLGCYPGTLRRWVHAGKVQTVDPPLRTRERRRLRFEEDYIQGLIERETINA